MQHISKISVLTIAVCFLFFPFLLSGHPDQENPLTKAIQLFDKKNFREAEPAFKKLLDERPDDFMINYFYGASRTENGHYSDKDLQYLNKASKEVYPIDIDFYFGVQYHAKSDWGKALSYYNNFKKVASADDQKRVDLNLKIEQCSNQINPFVSESETIIADTILTRVSYIDSTTNEAKTVTIVEESNPEITPGASVVIEEEMNAENDTTGEKNSESEINTTNNTPAKTSETIVVQEPAISFNINSEITYLVASNFRTSEGIQYYNEGNAKQTELDKINLRTEILREQYSGSKNRTEKDSLGQVIISLENDAYTLKTLVRQLYLQAKNAENNYWNNASAEETEKFINELNELKEAIAKENAKEKVTPVTGILLSPLLEEDAPVQKQIHENKNTGITYKIQLGAFSKGIPNSRKPVFKKITLIRKVETYTDEKGVVVYTTGNLTRFEDAQVMLTQVKQEGVKDAIIAAYLNGKRITLEQAKETEKQK